MIEQLAHTHRPWDVFSDFLEMSAISMSNAVDHVKRDEREERYQAITKRYTADDLALFPQMFAELVEALEAGFDDVLGRVFHDLELHNKWHGQFFTPYALCQATAKMTVGGRAEIDRAMESKGYMAAMEPACGSGAMVIALAEVMKDAEVNYQQALHVTAIDVDLKCVHMAYLQLALLGVPAIVVHGNSLSLEEYSRWYTPAHILSGWSWRLRRAVTAPAEVVSVTVTEAVACGAQLDLLAGAA